MLHQSKLRVFVVDTLYSVAGSILYAMALITFAQNAQFAPGGISGLSLIVNRFTGWPIGLVSVALNIPIVLVCLRVIGTRFLVKSLWTILINTIFLDYIFPLVPVYTGNRLLASMFTGVLMGAGLALIYMRGSSTGGADFLIMTVKKLRPSFSVGQISLAIDALIIVAGGFAFKDVDSVLYGIVSAFALTFTMDNVLYGAGSSKLAIIITNQGQRIAEAISNETGRGSTLVRAVGTYTGKEREMLYCACGKNEIYKVRTAARAVDPDALVMITEANEVVGEGFVPPNIPGNEDPPPLQKPPPPPPPALNPPENELEEKPD